MNRFTYKREDETRIQKGDKDCYYFYQYRLEKKMKRESLHVPRLRVLGNLGFKS